MSITLYGSLAIKFGAQHPQAKDEDAQGQKDTESKANTPHGLEMLFSRCREHDQEHGNGQWTTELIQRYVMDS